MQVTTALLNKFQRIEERLREIQRLLTDLSSALDVIDHKYTPDAKLKALPVVTSVKFAKMLSNGIQLFDVFSDATKVAAEAGVVKTGVVVTDAASDVASAAAKPVAKTAGLALLAFGAAIDLYSIIEGSVKLHKGSPSAVANDIEEQVLQPLQEDELRLVLFFQDFADSQS